MKNNFINDKKLEKRSFFRWILNKLFLHPVLNSLPATVRGTVKKTHHSAKEVIKNKTTHAALEVLYGGKNKESSKTLKEKFFGYIWMHTDNARGVRNRLTITENEIENNVRRLYENGIKEMRLLSIASGSARSFLDVLKNVSDINDLKIHVTFLDKSELALEYSKGLYSVEDFGHNRFSFEWVKGTANTFLNNLGDDKKFHLVEMVGLMDYFDDEKVEKIMNSICNKLFDDGALVTANIIHNNEERFVTNVVGWRMIYRQPDEFAKLVALAPFSTVTKQVEPLNVHTIVTAVK